MPVFAFLRSVSERESPTICGSVGPLFRIGVQPTLSYGHPVQDHSFDHRDYHGIKFIEIRSGEWIDSLRVQYKRDGEVLPWTDRVGGDGGHDNPTIELEEGEDIIEVKGKNGRHDNTGVITSLTFTTNRGRTFGPFGQVSRWRRMTNRLKTFKIVGKVVGFRGTSGRFVSSIGCHIYGT